MCGPQSEKEPYMRLKNKVALVTGGAQGIGAGIVTRFCEEGAIVFIADLKQDEGDALVSRLLNAGHTASFLSLDVADEESWRNAYARIIETSGRIDVLVNNAGINIREPIEEMSVKNLDTMLAVNVRGPFVGIKHALPLMRKQGGGCIINMSSICGLVGHQYTTEAYSVTKGALTLMTKAVAVRHAKDKIRCNSIHPSTVLTPLVETFLKDPEKRAQRFGEIPLARLATIDDVADAVVYLASDEASFLTGVALPVDGGLTAS